MPGVSAFICGTVKTVPYFFVLSLRFVYHNHSERIILLAASITPSFPPWKFKPPCIHTA